MNYEAVIEILKSCTVELQLSEVNWDRGLIRIIEFIAFFGTMQF